MYLTRVNREEVICFKSQVESLDIAFVTAMLYAEADLKASCCKHFGKVGLVGVPSLISAHVPCAHEYNFYVGL